MLIWFCAAKSAGTKNTKNKTEEDIFGLNICWDEDVQKVVEDVMCCFKWKNSHGEFFPIKNVDTGWFLMSLFARELNQQKVEMSHLTDHRLLTAAYN